MTPPVRSVSTLVPYALLGALTLCLYHHPLGSYWLFDDPYNLRQTLAYPAWRFFLDPAVWRSMSLSYLTPLVNLSYAFDLRLGGFDASFFYAHQIAALWLLSAVLYRALNSHVSAYFAFCGASLFLVTAPAAAVAEMLMTRHYIEGLLFAMLSLHLFMTAARRNSWNRAALSALSYAVAVSAKELYVPLVLVLPFVPEGTARSRVRLCIPHAAVLTAYLVWRSLMLGSLLGGSSDEAPLALPFGRGFAAFLWNNLLASAGMITGQTEPTGALSLALIAATAALAGASLVLLLSRKNWRGVLFFLSAALASCALPLAAFPLGALLQTFVAYRLALLPALFWAAAVVSAAHYLYGQSAPARTGLPLRVLRGTLIALPAALVLILLTVSSGWIAGQRAQTILPIQQEARFFMSSGKDIMLSLSSSAFTAYYYQNLAFLRNHFRHEPSPYVAYAGYACMDTGEALPADIRAVFRYDPGKDRIADITAAYPLERAALRARTRDLPLSVSFSIAQGVVSYRLGPASAGRYLLLMGGEPGFYTTVTPTPRVMNARGATGIRCYLRFAWESPEGRMALSPEWLIDFSQNQEIIWSRDAPSRRRTAEPEPGTFTQD